MADVIIRGMEMPRDCSVCELSQKRVFASSVMCPITRQTVGYYDQGFHLEKHDCPLVPLPEGHGRLIDADAFKAVCLAATKEAKPDFIRNEDWLKSCVVTMSFCRDIDEQPTIVPAEGGGEDGDE